MICPNCDNMKTYILYSSQQDYAVRRRRRCPVCGFKFTTYERLAQAGILLQRKKAEEEEK